LKFTLLDINRFITDKNINPVESSKYYTSARQFDPKGLFSESIFGQLGSRNRKSTFGYIDLYLPFIHPEAYPIALSVHPSLTKLILNKTKYTITDSGELIEDETGESGIVFFIQNFDKINFDSFGDKNIKNIKYLKDNKSKIFITKYIVMPAGLRDIIIKENKTQIQYSEINVLYTRLINYIQILPTDVELLDPNLTQELYENAQKLLININKQIKELLKGKYGMIRGGIMKKVLDFSARLVIAQDMNLNLGEVGISWHILLKLFEPFFIHYAFKHKTMLDQIQDFMGVDDVTNKTITNFISMIYDEPESVPAMFKEQLIESLNEILVGKQVLYKRDPVENRESYMSAQPIVKDTNSVMGINPLDCVRCGADFDGDTMAIYSLLTNESIKQAYEQLNPSQTKSQWKSAVNQSINYSLEHDAAIIIYSATKK